MHQILIHLFSVSQTFKSPREARNPNLDSDQRIARARQVYKRDTETGC